MRTWWLLHSCYCEWERERKRVRSKNHLRNTTTIAIAATTVMVVACIRWSSWTQPLSRVMITYWGCDRISRRTKWHAPVCSLALFSHTISLFHTRRSHSWLSHPVPILCATTTGTRLNVNRIFNLSFLLPRLARASYHTSPHFNSPHLASPHCIMPNLT